jgi:DNA adenine methylase
VQKPQSYAEVYNDMDGDIVNLFRVLQTAEQRQQLIDLLVLTLTRAPSSSRPSLRRQIQSSALAEQSSGPKWVSDPPEQRREVPAFASTAQHIWARFPDRIAAIGQRLAGVLIEYRPAIEVMQAHDTPDTLHFVDPPYLHRTRIIGSNRYYRHEMTDDEHRQLLDSIKSLQGMIVVCGYPSQLYDEELAGWTKNSKTAACAAGRGAASRQECIWLNQSCMNRLSQRGLALETTA